MKEVKTLHTFYAGNFTIFTWLLNCLNNMNLHWGDENLRYEEFEHVTKLHLLHLLMIWKTSLNFAPLTLPLH